jgi:RHS repeat-associated protein
MYSGRNQLYSQGFNFSSFIQKGVDPRTGQYTCAINIYESPSEARNCPPLQLSLSYNPLARQDIGLGQGWSFNLSGYQHRQSNNRSLFLSTGEHYQVTETSSLVSVNDQKLQNFQFIKKVTSDEDGDKTITYQITHKSGLIEILSNADNTYDTTVPIELYAATGRSLKLVWTNFGEQPRLSKIQEGDRELLEIDYTDAQVDIVRNPNTTEASTFSLVRANDQLVELKLPLEGEGEEQAAWTFTYETFDQGITCLSTVTGPAGLLEEVQYKQDGHRLPDGAPYQTIPYIILHTVRPGSQQPPIETGYNFSDHNFLGYDGCYDWNDGEDNLYRVPDEYQYTSTVQVQGGTETKYTYNKFHLIIDTRQQNGTKQVTQTTTYYALQNAAFEDQPAQYQLPKMVQITYRDTASKASRTETSQHVFDEWGNPTQEIEANGIKTDRTYYLAAGEKDIKTGEIYCPADPNGFQRYLKEETVTPAESAYTTPTRSKRYTYQELPAATGACPMDYFVVAQQMQVLEDGQCISSTELAYVNQSTARDHGRPQQTITQLSGQYPKTRDWTYQYPTTEQLVESVRTKTFDGVTIQDETGYSLSSGSTISHRDPAGNLSLLQYDKIGRQVSLTVSPGTPYEATRRHEYAVWKEGERAAGYRVTVTDAKSVKTRYITDGMGRVCRIESQDDDGQWSEQGDITTYSGTFRLVQESRYNALDQCVKVVDVDWLRGTAAGNAPIEQRSSQSFEYDDWGQKCTVTQSSGVATYLLADPIFLTYTEGIEGEGKTETRLNRFGLPTQTRLLKNDGSLCSKEEYAYDGLGRLVTRKDNSGHTKQVSYDGFDRVTQTIWLDSHVTNARYATQSAAALPISINTKDNSPFAEQAFDGFDRLIKRTVGGRTTQQTYQGNEPEPTAIVTPRGDIFHPTHDPALNHALTSLTSSDSANTYQYDTQTAAMTQFKDVYSTGDLQYLPSGIVTSESVKIETEGKTFSAHSTYSMAGKLQYYADVHGQKHEIQYDNFGRPQQLAQGKFKVTFGYDKADRLSDSCAKDEENDLSLITHLKYDDFGREIERVVVQNGEKTLYRLSQAYDGIGFVATRDLRDDGGNLLRHEGFQYDSLGRLVDYQCRGSGGSLPADDKGHQLQHQQFTFDNYDSLIQVSTVFQDGSENTASYMYSDQDPTQVVKITNTHPDYPSRIDLDYDANGCLIRDEQGRILEYDSMNRLSTVRDANQQLLSQYRYDATGKLVCQMVPGQPDTQLSYRGDTLIAVTTGNSHVSYVSDGKVYWGQTKLQKGGGDGDTRTSQIWAPDFHQSVLTYLDSQSPDLIHDLHYTPYGFVSSAASGFPSIGFNGQWRDPVTGWYHLGNGYRVYNPVLMRFHTPDAWSPFTSGEVNGYAYCSGDPINFVDPSGHLSIFGLKLSDRDQIIAGVGLGVGIIVGILTGGAGLAIVIGASIAAGVVSDVATGAIYDWASGKSPTWESVGTDALYGAIGGILGEGDIGGVAKAGMRRLSRTVEQLLEGSLKLRRARGRLQFRGMVKPLTHLEKRIKYFKRKDKLTQAKNGPARIENKAAEINRRDAWTWGQSRAQQVLNQDQTVEASFWEQFYAFRHYVSEQRLQPFDAAKLVNPINFDKLRGRPERTIRLSGKHQLVFTVNEEKNLIQII